MNAYINKINEQTTSFNETLFDLTNKETDYQYQIESEQRVQRARSPVIKKLEELNS